MENYLDNSGSVSEEIRLSNLKLNWHDSEAPTKTKWRNLVHQRRPLSMYSPLIYVVEGELGENDSEYIPYTSMAGGHEGRNEKFPPGHLLAVRR